MVKKEWKDSYTSSSGALTDDKEHFLNDNLFIEALMEELNNALKSITTMTIEWE